MSSATWRCRLGEGPRWRDGVLTWVDIEGMALHRLDGSLTTTRFDARLGCANPTEDGDVVVALADRIQLASTGEVLARFPHGPEIRGERRSLRSAGAAVGGDDGARRDAGRRRSVPPRRRGADDDPARADDRERHRLVAGPHARLLHRHADAADRRVRLRRRARCAVDVRSVDGFPDGLTVDDEGCVWVAV